MANQKRPKFPSKTCPKCGELIHARSMKHDACGWVMAPGAARKTSKKGKKLGRPKKVVAARNGSSITMADIEAVKAIVDRLGAEKVRQLADVLA